MIFDIEPAVEKWLPERLNDVKEYCYQRETMRGFMDYTFRVNVRLNWKKDPMKGAHSISKMLPLSGIKCGKCN